jgi:hypothetical protein
MWISSSNFSLMLRRTLRKERKEEWSRENEREKRGEERNGLGEGRGSLRWWHQEEREKIEKWWNRGKKRRGSYLRRERKKNRRVPSLTRPILNYLLQWIAHPLQ